MENQNEVQTAARQIVKKITTKVVLGGKPDLEKLFDYAKEHGEDAIMPLYGIIGIASDYTAGQTDMGAFVKLIGQFKAVAHDGGAVFRSGACILPGAASDLIFGALRAAGEESRAVEFALRIGIKKDKTAATNYVYVVEQVYQPQAQDALGNLERSLGGGNVQAISDKSNEQKTDEKAQNDSQSTQEKTSTRARR
jgi:hypothetical protein